jgi:hypothetical protein
MKKLILLAVAIVSFAGVTSCSNNNESDSLLGKWENFKLGTVTNGQETLTDYVTAIGCTKNYAIINATTIISHNFNGSDCFESINNQSYSRQGDVLRVAGETASLTYEIKTLDSTTLKIYLTAIDTEPASQVFVFKRIN